MAEGSKKVQKTKQVNKVPTKRVSNVQSSGTKTTSSKSANTRKGGAKATTVRKKVSQNTKTGAKSNIKHAKNPKGMNTTTTATKANVKNTSTAKKVTKASKTTKGVQNTAKKVATPKRADQEKKNLHPIVPVVGATLTKDERKEAKAKEIDEHRNVRLKQDEALRKTGDDRYLPLRDKGLIKKHIRELVDAKRSPAEFFLIVAVIALVLSMFIQQFSVVASFYLTILVYIYLFTTVGHLILKGRKIKKLVVEKFGEKAGLERGLTMYAVNRMTQPRFARLPKVGL